MGLMRGDASTVSALASTADESQFWVLPKASADEPVSRNGLSGARPDSAKGCRWSQGVDATLVCSLSAGVRNPNVCLGRVLSLRAMSSNSDCEKLDRPAVFGRYWRNRPFVFSLEPRCQGLCGSQK